MKSSDEVFYDRYWENDHIKINAFDHPPSDWSEENFTFHQNFFKKFIETKNNLSVLDYGSGRGDFLNFLAKDELFSKVYGLEISEAAIAYSKKHYPNQTIIKANGSGIISLGDKTLDCIYCIDVLEHLLDVETFFEECYRVLKNGGHLFIATTLINRLKLLIIASFFIDDYFFGTSPHIRFFTKKNLRKLTLLKNFDYMGFCRNRSFLFFVPYGQMIAIRKK